MPNPSSSNPEKSKARLARACATAALAAVALLSVGEAWAQSYSMRFHDISDLSSSGSNRSVALADLTGLPDISDGGVLEFAESESRAYAFSAAGALSLSRPSSVVRIELLGAGADQYELMSTDGGGLNIRPDAPLEVILSASREVGKFSVRAPRDADSAPPSSATLRISRVSGDAIANLPLQFALRTTEPPVDVVLVGIDGRALTAVTLAESTPSSAFHVELRERDSEVSLINDEDIDVQITIVDLAGVSFAEPSATTRTLNLTIAANTTRTASFRLIAAADGDDVSESGTLALLARSGGVGSPLAADATATALVSVEDAFAVPFVLDLNHNGSLSPTDFVIMGRVALAVDRYVNLNTYDQAPGVDFVSQLKLPERTVDLSRTDPDFLDFLKMLGGDVTKNIPDDSRRNQTSAWVAQMWEHYFDDLDVNGNGSLSPTDFIIMARVVSAIQGYITGNTYDDDPGFDFVTFLEPDNTVDPNKPENAELLNVLVADIERSIPEREERYAVAVRIIALMFRADILPPTSP